MKIIKVKVKRYPYNIVIGKNILPGLGQYLSRLRIGNSSYIITNSLIYKKYGVKLEGFLKDAGFAVKFKIVPDSERSKSLETVSVVIKDIIGFEKGKKVFIVAFGGGVVGDLSGFVASIYKRGIPYIQIPTTLLAQVDSSIGGKTAVDLKEGKNLLGAFYQPKLVFSETGFLKTLSLRQMRSALAEVIKYAAIEDARLFSYLENNYRKILAHNSNALEYVIERCSRIKAGIVEQDEREEKGIRTALNFGHTIGHAIESAGSYKGYNHGEAIAIGMLVACGIGEQLRLTPAKTTLKLERLIKRVGLSAQIKGVSSEKIIRAHYRDKKFIGAKNRFVLLENIGKTKIVENIPLSVIRKALSGRF